VSWYEDQGFRPYVSVAERRARAQRELAKLTRKGRVVSPVTLAGRTIASSYWGKAWCNNLESYSDYASRLPRGRTYVRNGSVMDLQITAGKVTALVCGSELYTVTVTLARLPPARWQAITAACAGKIASVVELLQGKLSGAVLEVLARRGDGLFPEPREIGLDCTCPDSATMCKHVAATLYGVGARLDTRPELFFTMRQVDQTELIASASAARALTVKTAAKPLASSKGLSKLFGIDLDGDGDGDGGGVGDAPKPRKPRKPPRPRAG
jgi:uncharacterized Zn finger protein